MAMPVEYAESIELLAHQALIYIKSIEQIKREHKITIDKLSDVLSSIAEDLSNLNTWLDTQVTKEN